MRPYSTTVPDDLSIVALPTWKPATLPNTALNADYLEAVAQAVHASHPRLKIIAATAKVNPAFGRAKTDKRLLPYPADNHEREGDALLAATGAHQVYAEPLRQLLKVVTK